MPISDQVLHPGGLEAAPVVPASVPAPPAAPEVPAPVPVPEESRPEADTEQVAWHVDEAAPEESGGAVARAGRLSLDWAKAGAGLLKSLRTLLFFIVSGGLVVLAKANDIDVANFASHLVGNKVKPEDLLIFMSVAGVVLRFVTTTPIFARWRTAAGGGTLFSTANVDDPDEQ